MITTHPVHFVLLSTWLSACVAPPLEGAVAPPPLRSPEHDVSAATPRPALAAEARALIDFWRAAGPGLWFAKDPEFDRRFRERFAQAHASAIRGELEGWMDTADGALALILLLDQYPRNSFRGTPRMYATDAAARAIATRAVEAGFDRQLDPELQVFVILPFGHSEELADQERAVDLSHRLGPRHRQHAEHHRDIVQRFGRFPHRNVILGRESTDAERNYLESGGYQG
jgi:uncharacterized protein (DUF924 family)